MLQVQEVVLQGITKIEIQEIFRQTLRSLGKKIPNNLILYFDTSYLYTFEKADVPYIRKFTDTIRLAQTRKYNPKAIEWHNLLERWYQDQTVNIFDREIKPTQIQRSIDRVVNEMLELIAQGMAAGFDIAAMKYNAIGDGASEGTDALPGDTALVNEISRIDVTQDSGGGGLSVDGSTFMNIGNHSIDVQNADITETGIFNQELPGAGEDDVPIIDDQMGDHSIYPDAVEHIAGINAPGSTIVIWQCSS